MKFFYKNAINVFTDASLTTVYSKKLHRDIRVVCPAYIVTMGGGVLEYGSKVFSRATNSYGEIYAILLGLKALLKYKDSDMFLNLYSDSEISIKGLTNWILDWYIKGKDSYVLRSKANGSFVANQEVFLEILKTVCENKVHVNLFNLLGHTDKDNVKDMFKFDAYFVKSNNLFGNSIPVDFLQEMAGFNDMVDKMSRETLYKVIQTKDILKYPKRERSGIYWFPKDEDINLYYELVNK